MFLIKRIYTTIYYKYESFFIAFNVHNLLCFNYFSYLCPKFLYLLRRDLDKNHRNRLTYQFEDE